MIDLTTLTLTSAREHLDKGDFSAKELASAYLTEIEKKNPSLNAYLEVFDDVEAQATEADKKIAGKKSTTSKTHSQSNPSTNSLLGIPLSMKDNILIEGRIASASSKMLERYKAPYDATVTKKLKEAGAIFLGRTNMDEFAMGGSTENSAFGPTKNPHDESRVPGGSSGGAAAALAANLCLASIGSDTGGSIRQPASFCGVVGLKPTYGMVSRSGLMAMASSLDQIGPLTKTVDDAELLFNVIRGNDPLDSTTLQDATILGGMNVNVANADGFKKNVHNTKKYTIGVPRAFISEGIDTDVLDNFNRTLKALEKEGHTIRDIELPNLHFALSVYYIVMPAEVSSNLARLDGVKYGLHVASANTLEEYLNTREQGFGIESRRRIMLGTYVLSTGYYDAYYGKATALRARLSQDFRDVFTDGIDIVATPTSPTSAFKLGEHSSDPLSMYLADIFTVSANLTSLPAISVPDGKVTKGNSELPTGIQFTAPFAREDMLFEIGQSVESVRKNTKK